ncbi:hypothetical protein [Methylotuvimicrobium sp.]|jgi:hypothetical protein|uniref:hypothetical protein n=1 Tax=Methylotuvimicrobium sp. TaxID=2822413 RepID=UPI003D662638
MKARIVVLDALISFRYSIEQLKRDLSHFPWDSEEELVEVKLSDVTSVLQRYIDGLLKKEELIEWANTIECRDDIGFENGFYDVLKETIYVLANPEINEPLDKNKATEMKQFLISCKR